MKVNCKFKKIRVLALILGLSFLLNTKSSHAQTDTTYEPDFLDSLNIIEMYAPWNFYAFKSPDSSFTELEGGSGFTNVEWKATIKFSMAFPLSLVEIKQKEDIKNFKVTPEGRIIDTISNSEDSRKYFIIITEEFAHEDSVLQNFIFISTMVEFEKSSVGIVGVYPKSKDKEWRKKFIDAALSVRKKEKSLK